MTQSQEVLSPIRVFCPKEIPTQTNQAIWLEYTRLQRVIQTLYCHTDTALVVPGHLYRVLAFEMRPDTPESTPLCFLQLSVVRYRTGRMGIVGEINCFDKKLSVPNVKHVLADLLELACDLELVIVTVPVTQREEHFMGGTRALDELGFVKVATRDPNQPTGSSLYQRAMNPKRLTIVRT